MSFRIENGVLENYTEEDGVTEVVIPDGVTSIGNIAFSCCINPYQHNNPRQCYKYRRACVQWL
jgi:hypothetical protein